MPKTRARTQISLNTSKDGQEHDLHVTMKDKVCHNKAINRHPLVRTQPNRKVIPIPPCQPQWNSRQRPPMLVMHMSDHNSAIDESERILCDASEDRQLVLSRCCTITGVMSPEHEVDLGSDGDQVRVRSKHIVSMLFARELTVYITTPQEL